MNAVLIKTAAAAFAAFAFANSAAFADDSSLSQKISDQLAETQQNFLAVVMASTEERINSMQDADENEDNLILAENDAEPTS